MYGYIRSESYQNAKEEIAKHLFNRSKIIESKIITNQQFREESFPGMDSNSENNQNKSVRHYTFDMDKIKAENHYIDDLETSCYNAIPLGCYTKMKSPGEITLYADNMAQFILQVFQKLANYQKYILSIEQVNIVINTIIDKTILHEHFHYACDIFQHMHTVNFDPLIEEPLAVVFSHRMLSHSGKFSPFINPFNFVEYYTRNKNNTITFPNNLIYKSDLSFIKKILKEFMFSPFDNISPYNQWRNYLSHKSYCDGIEKYIIVKNNIKLKASIKHIAPLLLQSAIATFSTDFIVRVK